MVLTGDGELGFDSGGNCAFKFYVLAFYEIAPTAPTAIAAQAT